jgi:RHS repeat-associated protein
MNRSLRTLHIRQHPWPLKLVAWLTVLLQLALPFNSELFAAQAALLTPTGRSVRAYPAPVLTPQRVTINRTKPAVETPSLDLRFSEQPTDEELSRARVFPVPLVPARTSGSPSENRDLARALKQFRDRTDADDASGLEDFLIRHPDSKWQVSLLANLAAHYRSTMQFTKAMAAWQEAWKLGKTIADPSVKDNVDAAVSELARFLVTLGWTDQLQALLKDLEGRPLRGGANVRIDDARSALWHMQTHPERTFKCGPFSLFRVRSHLNLPEAAHPLIQVERATTNGTSLAQVWSLAQRTGMKYQMALRASGAAVPLPCIVHWKIGHFSALVSTNNGLYLVEDGNFRQGWISPKVLDEEASGYFLIPEGPLPAGWDAVAEEEGQNAWGRSGPPSTDPNLPPCPPAGGGYSAGGPNTKKCKKGMAQYTVDLLRVGLIIADVPVGYAPPVGPEVEFRLTYYERDVNQPATFTFSNLGPQWTHGWMAYVEDNTTTPAANVLLLEGGGGAEVYTGFDPNTQSFAVQPYSHCRLVRTSSTSYEQRYADGRVNVFSQPDSTNGSRHVFITQQRDAAGNALTFTYDSSFRLVSVQDALGQVTTLSYPTNGDTLKIVKVTDPFGRYTSFQYNAAGQLTNIVDVIGLSSTLTYSSGSDYINALTTPYGTTTFVSGGVSGDPAGRWIEITDPEGQKERVEYNNSNSAIYGTESASVVPTGLNTYNSSLNARNTFYWDKTAMSDAPGDYRSAQITHWVEAPYNYEQITYMKESVKTPLENRVWYNYPGQGQPYYAGALDQPSAIARVLDDGTTQLYQFARNDLGKATSSVDPAGRTTLFTYDSNEMDLLQVQQQNGGTTDLLAQFTYNSQHLPLTAVDAAGQTNCFGYNASGQLVAATNALGQTLSLAYDANGYLTNITGALPEAVTSFTYDGFGRVQTVTDSQGYTVAYDYDALDRPTKVTYPDASYEQIAYENLDPVLTRDRMGRWTAQTYDALRHLMAVEDALGRVTSFDWCTCGALNSITDPFGRTTTWLRDLQGRATTKVYPDGTLMQYAYEQSTSRLNSVTDAKDQTTIYDYFVDDNLKQVAYSNAVVATPGVAFAYDTNYNRLLTMMDGTGTTAYNYNPITSPPALGAGRLASVVGALPSSTVTYAYDALGRVTNRAINGVSMNLTYDPLGRVTVVTNALGGFTNAYLGATAQVTTNSYPNGQVTCFSYYDNTNDRRLQTLWNQNASGGTVSKFDYTYNADGQIATWTQQADAQTPNVWVMDYDPVNQLLGVTVRSNTVVGAVLKQFVYGYDPIGNRLGESIKTASTSSLVSASFNNVNQLTALSGGGPVLFKGSLNKPGVVTVGGNPAAFDSRTSNFVGTVQASVGTNVIPVVAADFNNNRATNSYQIVVTNSGTAETLTYDLNGNLVSAVTATSTNTYEWDAANRLVAINVATNRSEFGYDGFGRRIQILEKQNGIGVSTNTFLWCGLELCEQRDASGTVTTKRFFTQGEQIASANYYITRDHLGSVREMTDSSGMIRARYDYNPYGRRTKVSGDKDADFGFTGHYCHIISGLHLTLFRAYDANIGRWLSRDLLSEEGGLNLYTYALNDPMNVLDAFGLFSWSCFGKGALDGATATLAIVVGAALLATIAPVAAPAITAVLLIAGGVGIVRSLYGIATSSGDTQDYRFGSLAGSLLAGGLSARPLATKLTLPGYPPPAAGLKGWNPLTEYKPFTKTPGMPLSLDAYNYMGTAPSLLGGTGGSAGVGEDVRRTVSQGSGCQ